MRAHTPLDQLLLDLFTTALEGGINYWSWCKEYHWMNPDESSDYKGFRALIAEEDGEDQVAYTIDRDVLLRGYTLATTAWRENIRWSSEKPPVVVTRNTDWDFDAGDADCIVQLGLFGQVVYG